MGTVQEELQRLGGVARRGVLVERCSRRAVDAALGRGEVLSGGRGCLHVPQASEALVAAIALNGALCLASAALHHGWAVKHVPDPPQVTLPRSRRLKTEGLGQISWLRLAPGDVMNSVTTRDRTLVDCLRALPADEALAVADSALREGYPAGAMRALARDLRGPGSAQARVVAARANGAAANPFESVLRWISYHVPGLAMRPQVTIRQSTADVVGGGASLVSSE